MKEYPAIATVEFSDISTGYYLTDIMVKKSPISLLKSGTISQGRYVVMIGGTTGSVEEAYKEALYWEEESMLDHAFLPDVHEKLHDAILTSSQGMPNESMIVLETDTISCNIIATERALKAIHLEILELRLADSQLAGKGLTLLTGALSDMEDAQDIIRDYLTQAERSHRIRVITSPDAYLAHQMATGTRFADVKQSVLKGERL